MKKFRFISAFFFAIATVSSFSFADDASKAEAEKLLNTMNVESLLQTTMTEIIDSKIKQDPTLGVYKDVIIKFLNKYMSYQSVKDDLTKMYAEEFSSEELADIRRFYESKSGKKALEKMPALAARGSQIGQQKVREHIGELQNMILAEAERIQKLQNQNK